METIIEESIWDIKQKLPLRKAIFTYDGEKITRNLFILGDSERRNNKIDVIEYFNISIKEINKISSLEIGDMLKNKINKCFETNVNNEIPFFTLPIITKK
jgi:hypothetical protein